ncbi:1-aminocyclopropane-1-carboxylate deaminase/D-cysteine desulfhydrase [Afifella pfennigii]|uniref:1-aminocyclopropane-1-carboxylate deaminase/D-cysteine desulfhydrase n=1 Tax=Afifella pfennigii TaxID=209897 RepID=UPI000478D299|nr:pyridoxal-phosphate dependent enzyme [Afifella pfennigii]
MVAQLHPLAAEQALHAAGAGAAGQGRLALQPTPIEASPALSAEIGLDVWVKREDRHDAIGSGVKRRAVAAVLAHRAASGKKAILTDGVPQSNCMRAMAHYCRQEGVPISIILRGPAPSSAQGNYRAILQSGAEVVQIEDPLRFEACRQAKLAELEERGLAPLIVPAGAAAPFALAGPIGLGCEIAAQEKALGISFDTVVLPVGTGGTIIGLYLSRHFHDASWRVVGVRIDDYERMTYRRRLAECAQALGIVPPQGVAPELVDELPFTLFDGALGSGYGHFTDADVEESERLLAATGLYFGPTYMLKALRGLKAMAAAGEFDRRHKVLLVHTGGVNERAALQPGKCQADRLAVGCR